MQCGRFLALANKKECIGLTELCHPTSMASYHKVWCWAPFLDERARERWMAETRVLLEVFAELVASEQILFKYGICVHFAVLFTLYTH